jgi:hypothetical protein
MQANTVLLYIRDLSIKYLVSTRVQRNNSPQTPRATAGHCKWNKIFSFSVWDMPEHIFF